MNPTSLLPENLRATVSWGLCPHTPGFLPSPRRLTPDRDRHDKGDAYERSTRVNKQSKESQRRLDSRFRNGILHDQVASFSMHFWLIFR